ncbi:MAG: macro domain-containing protein [Lachnospiraceae bacterium]
MPFQIVRNDITKMQVDAIVNTANRKPEVGYGVDFAIYQSAGFDVLLKARRQIGEIKVGEAAVTAAFRLNAKYIIHTVGPAWRDGEQGEEALLRSCYRNALNAAQDYDCESIAFPLIASGNHHFSKEKALQVAVEEIREYLSKSEMMIYLVVYDRESFVLSQQLQERVTSYIDQHLVESEHLDSSWRQLRHSRNLRKSRYSESYSRSIGNEESDEDVEFYSVKTRSIPKAKLSMPSGSTRKLEDVMKEMSETFQQNLLRLIDQKGMTDVEVYKKANIDRKLFSKIRSNINYQPTKKTALALALALELNLDETKDLLARAGMAFSPCSKFDVIVEYFIENQVYDIYTINMTLFQYDQILLGQ